MAEIIKSLTTGPILERVVTFLFLMAACVVGYYGLLGLLRALGRRRVKVGDVVIGPAEEESEHRRPEPAHAALEPAEPHEDPPPVQVATGVRKSILEHKLFLAEAELRNLIRGLDDGSNKAAVAVAFLDGCKFASVYRHMKKFARNIEETSGEELKNFPIVLNHIIMDYNTAAKTHEYRIGSKILCGVPQSWERKFNKWHNPHVDMLLRSIRSVLTDDYYYDWWVSATACFDLMYTVLQLTVEDAYKALLEINGELDREIEGMLCRG